MSPPDPLGHGLRGVVFDVDGTLFDSERDGHRVAFNAAFAEAGMPDRWDAETYGTLLAVPGGRPRLEHYLRDSGHSAEEAQEFANDLHVRKTRCFTRMVEEGAIGLRPGARRLVEELAAQQVRLFVATTGSRAWVEPLLRRHFGDDPFELVVTGSEVSRLKPDPEAYLEVLARAGLTPAGVVAIEDSAAGLQAAHAAGLPCVIVRNAYTRADDFALADLVLDGFEPLTVDMLATTAASKAP